MDTPLVWPTFIDPAPLVAIGKSALFTGWSSRQSTGAGRTESSAGEFLPHSCRLHLCRAVRDRSRCARSYSSCPLITRAGQRVKSDSQINFFFRGATVAVCGHDVVKRSGTRLHGLCERIGDGGSEISEAWDGRALRPVRLSHPRVNIPGPLTAKTAHVGAQSLVAYRESVPIERFADSFQCMQESSARRTSGQAARTRAMVLSGFCSQRARRRGRS